MKYAFRVSFLVTSVLILLGATSFGQSIETQKDTADTTNYFQLSLAGRYNYSEADLQKFKDLVETTLQWSADKGRAAIIVDKAAYKLFLFKDGALHSSYPVELGQNPYDDKWRRGDSCTPEGTYKITWKRDIGQTIFYRAFLINYPNAEDKIRFRQLLDSGTIPADSEIGGDIEIHGQGSGKPGNAGGYNWTLGCISLSNDDIDAIFPHMENGDMVTIIRYGSSFILK